MTMAKMQKLKKQMVNEFGSIFDLCKNVLSTPSTNIYLINATLETLLKFISWIPIQFVYQQDLIQILESNVIYTYIYVSVYRFICTHFSIFSCLDHLHKETYPFNVLPKLLAWIE